MATLDHPHSQQIDAATSGRLLAVRLGYAGLLPFIAPALWLVVAPADHPWRDAIVVLLMVYAATILSFLGGARFGLTIGERQGPSPRILVLSMLPPLVGWLVVFAEPPYALAAFAVAFAAQGAWDAMARQVGTLPEWFGRLRVRLTIWAVAALMLAFFATA